MWIAILAFAGIGVAVYLTLYKAGMIAALACSIGSCETVQTSRYATMLGLPVAAWGVAYYVALFGVAFVGTTATYETSPAVSTALLILTGWGTLFSVWLTYLELFVIHAICTWCVISAVIVTLAFLVSVLEFRESRMAQDGPTTA